MQERPRSKEEAVELIYEASKYIPQASDLWCGLRVCIMRSDGCTGTVTGLPKPKPVNQYYDSCMVHVIFFAIRDPF